PFVRFRYALTVLMPHNRLGEAIAEIEGALESDPLAVTTRVWLGIMHLLARNYDRAIDEGRSLRELEPASCWPHFISGIALRQKYYEEFAAGRRMVDWAEQAIAGHQQAIELAPGSDYFLGWLGLAYGMCGKRAEALGVLEQL